MFLSTHDVGCAVLEISSTDETTGQRFDAICRDLFVGRVPAHLRLPSPLRMNVGRARPVAASGEHSARAGHGDAFRVTLPGASLTVDVTSGMAAAAIEPTFWELDASRQRAFLMTGVVGLLHGRELFALHANALQGPAGGWLLVGPSGAGKTTLSAALARAGWSWVADDAVLLRRQRDAVLAFAVRRGCSLTPETAATFGPTAGDGLVGPRGATRRGKYLFDELPGMGSEQELSCQPSVIVLVAVGAGPDSEIEPVDETTALSRLMEQSPGILLDPGLAPRQLELLQATIGQCTLLVMRSGKDVMTEPARVARALERAAAAARDAGS